MRLLLTAELGQNPRWLRWLDTESRNVDLVVIAGDLINVFHPEPLNVQILKAKAFLRSLAQHTRVAVSSGNHDTVDAIVEAPRGPIPVWLAGLDSVNTLLSDGRTSVIRQRLIITTLSYISNIDRKRTWLAEGAELRKKTSLPWLVVHHHPPAFEGSAGPEELSAGRLLKEFGPTIWIAGRFFDQAHPCGFNWMQTIDQSIVLNIAQTATGGVAREAAFPNHIVCDLERGRIQWNSWLGSANEERELKLS